MRLTLPISTIIACVVLLGACGASAGLPVSRAAGGPREPANATATASSPAKGTPVPAKSPYWYADGLEKLGFYVFPHPIDVGDFTVPSLGNGSETLSRQRGKVVLLNFWATWCPSCRKEMPSIETLWKKLKDKPFTIMAISVGEARDTVNKFIVENKYTYPVFLDPDSKLGAAFDVSGIPTTYLVDKDGKVIAGNQGAAEYDSEKMMKLLSELSLR